MILKSFRGADKTPHIIKKAVNDMVDLVAATYGPAGNNILTQLSTFDYRAVDDGITIAKNFGFVNEFEDAVAWFIRDTTFRTNDRGGDGTTSSLILLKAIINKVYENLDTQLLVNKVNSRQIVKEIQLGLIEAKNQLWGSVLGIDIEEQLKNVAKMSFANDEVAGKIADIYMKIGKEGVITIEDIKSNEIISEIVQGFQINKGYVSPYMVTNDKAEARLENVYVLVTDKKIDNVQALLPITNKISKNGQRELVIIAEDYSPDVIGTLVANKMRGVFNVLAVKAPYYAEKKVDALKDIAALTGATFVSDSMGNKFDTLELPDLGKAEKVIAKKDNTIFVGDKTANLGFDIHISNLKQLLPQAKSEYDRKDLERRISRLENGVAILRVGGATDTETAALHYKVEDAVNAVKAAYKNGVVKGGGLSLYGLKTSSGVLNEALKAPFRQLSENCDIDIKPETLKDNEVVDFSTGEVKDYLSGGIYDPVDVVVAALESAVSVATLLISCKGIITDKRRRLRNVFDEVQFSDDELNDEANKVMEDVGMK